MLQVGQTATIKNNSREIISVVNRKETGTFEVKVTSASGTARGHVTSVEDVR